MISEWLEACWVKARRDKHKYITIDDWHWYVTYLIERSSLEWSYYIDNMDSKGYTFIKILWQDDVPAEIRLYFDFARVGVQIKDGASSIPFFIYLLTSADKKYNSYIMRGSLGANPVDVAEIITNAETGEILEKKCYV